MLKTLFCGAAILLYSTPSAFGVEPENPALVIDGRLNEAVWQNLPAEKLIPEEDGVPASLGGDVRTVVIGRYLYVGARLPEPTGRITARMIGRNPSWEDEDLLKILCGPDIGYTDRIMQINPWGAYSVEKAVHVASNYLPVYPYSLEKPPSQVLYRNASSFLVATSIGEHDWMVEAAIPLNELSARARKRSWSESSVSAPRGPDLRSSDGSGRRRARQPRCLPLPRSGRNRRLASGLR